MLKRYSQPILFVVQLVFSIVVLTSAQPAQAQFDHDNIRPALYRIAKATSLILQREGLDSIGIGQFAGPPAFGSAAGSGLRLILKEEFAKLNVREQKINAAVGIQGKYFLDDRRDFQGKKMDGDKELKVEVELVDRSGSVLSNLNATAKIPPFDGAEFTEDVPISSGKITIDTFGSPGEVGSLLGATVDLAGKLEENIRSNGPYQDPIVGSFDNPTAIVQGGTTVASSRNSPFTMEILVDGQPRRITLEEGQPFVDLQKNEQFQIRVTNLAPYDVAAIFTLDGVNSFAFSDLRYRSGAKRGEPLYSKWIVPRSKPFTLKGWHRTNEHVDAFLVTDFSNSAAAKFGSTVGVGTITITVAIRATWKEGEQPPSGEPLAAKMEVGIGRGERLGQRVRADTAKREYGIVRSLITIRYAKPE